MAESLLINEIFHSVQGESSYVGRPCVFVRLRGCHLRCVYCDTEYAFAEGHRMTIDETFAKVTSWPTPLVEITGGEPLLQKPVHTLMTRLCDASRTVLIETSGACDISSCDPRVIRIVDFKTPGSGECERNELANINHLTKQDEAKFVICDRADYQWARAFISEHDLTTRTAAVLLSPVHQQIAGKEIPGHDGLAPADLVAWMLEDGLDARIQLQMHKFIWTPDTRGV